LETDAEMAFVQLADQIVGRAIIVGGSSIKYEANQLLRTKRIVEYADIIKTASEYRINATGAVELVTPSPIRKT
jgi:hypothetical protein